MPSFVLAFSFPIYREQSEAWKILRIWVEKGTKHYYSILEPWETATVAASPAAGPDPARAELLGAPCAIHGAPGPFQPLVVQLPADCAARQAHEQG